jgi:hypothetical protein
MKIRVHGTIPRPTRVEKELESLPGPIIIDPLAGHATFKLASKVTWDDIYDLPPPTDIEIEPPEIKTEKNKSSIIDKPSEIIIAKFSRLPPKEEWDWSAKHTIAEMKNFLQKNNMPLPSDKTLAGYTDYLKKHKKELS